MTKNIIQTRSQVSKEALKTENSIVLSPIVTNKSRTSTMFPRCAGMSQTLNARNPKSKGKRRKRNSEKWGSKSRNSIREILMCSSNKNSKEAGSTGSRKRQKSGRKTTLTSKKMSKRKWMTSKTANSKRTTDLSAGTDQSRNKIQASTKSLKMKREISSSPKMRRDSTKSKKIET